MILLVRSSAAQAGEITYTVEPDKNGAFTHHMYAQVNPHLIGGITGTSAEKGCAPSGTFLLSFIADFPFDERPVRNMVLKIMDPDAGETLHSISFEALDSGAESVSLHIAPIDGGNVAGLVVPGAYYRLGSLYDVDPLRPLLVAFLSATKGLPTCP